MCYYFCFPIGFSSYNGNGPVYLTPGPFGGLAKETARGKDNGQFPLGDEGGQTNRLEADAVYKLGINLTS